VPLSGSVPAVSTALTLEELTGQLDALEGEASQAIAAAVDAAALEQLRKIGRAHV